MIKIAAFLLPKKEILKKIIYFKKQVKKKFGEQPYLNHPPHCTLFTIYANEKTVYGKEFKKELILNLSKYTNNNINIYKTSVFRDDPLTGGNTIIFKVKKNTYIKKIQKILLKRFNKISLKKNVKEKLKYKWMKKNFSIYGYPFVGKNWIPHFTIASINISDNKDEFINNFINYKLYLNEYIFKVSFYEVRKNNHIFLWDIDIKNHV